MRALVVGSGGREHALVWSLAGSDSVAAVHAAPGNPGIAALATCHPVRADDAPGLVSLALELAVDLVVIGPEGPLVAGVADALRGAGLTVLGPSAAAARIEGSKTFAKEVMEAAGVPTARRLSVPVAPCVVKADGLAAGKGVVICRTEDELRHGLEVVRSFGGELVAEELLEGPEVSLFALCDGVDARLLGVAQDFKRALDGDEGPNTGGMGSYAPVPGLDPGSVDALVDRTIRPVLAELAARDAPFVGVLFAGLMLTPDGPRVLEYNCRFGDPETQSLLPLLRGDFGRALAAAASGDLGGVELEQRPDAAVTIVMAGGEYPARGDHGSPITGIEAAEALGAYVFHAGTALADGAIVTDGGRVLGVTAVGPDLPTARKRAYAAADLVSWPGARRREDIAAAAAAGGGAVDVAAGSSLRA